MVPDLLRGGERRDFDRRGHCSRRGAGSGGPLLREYSRGPAGREAPRLGCPAHGRAAADRRGPRPSGPRDQGLERSSVGHSGGSPPGPCNGCARRRQELAPVQAARLRRPDRDQRDGVRQCQGDRRPGRPAGNGTAWRRPGVRRGGARRGTGTIPPRRAGAGGARAGQDGPQGTVHPRHGAHRRLRRQVRHPRPERGLCG